MYIMERIKYISKTRHLATIGAADLVLRESATVLVDRRKMKEGELFRSVRSSSIFVNRLLTDISVTRNRRDAVEIVAAISLD